MVDFVPLGRADDIFSRQKAAWGISPPAFWRDGGLQWCQLWEKTGELKYNSSAPGMNFWVFFVLWVVFFFKILLFSPLTSGTSELF